MASLPYIKRQYNFSAVNTNHFVQPFLEKVKKLGNNVAEIKRVSDEYDAFYKTKLDELELTLSSLN